MKKGKSLGPGSNDLVSLLCTAADIQCSFFNLTSQFAVDFPISYDNL